MSRPTFLGGGEWASRKKRISYDFNFYDVARVVTSQKLSLYRGVQYSILKKEQSEMAVYSENCETVPT